MPFGGAVSRTEVPAALSLAIDLGRGQPMDHMLRSAAMGTGLAERLGLGESDRGTVLYTGLVMWLGCHADPHEYARWFGDDIAMRHDSYFVDWSGVPGGAAGSEIPVAMRVAHRPAPRPRGRSVERRPAR